MCECVYALLSDMHLLRRSYRIIGSESPRFTDKAKPDSAKFQNVVRHTSAQPDSSHVKCDYLELLGPVYRQIV